MPSFDERDLQETAARIRAKLDGDEETLDLLQQLLDQAQAHQEMWNDQLEQFEQGQKSLLKAVTMLAKQSQSHGKMLQSVHKGLVWLAKSQRTPIAKSQSLAKSQGTVMPLQTPGAGLSLEETAKRGILAKAIANVLGSNGGHSYPYDAALASRMLLRGDLTPKQHQVWKRSNRLHDDAWAALQQRRVG
jgi:hypothetical protein